MTKNQGCLIGEKIALNDSVEKMKNFWEKWLSNNLLE